MASSSKQDRHRSVLDEPRMPPSRLMHTMLLSSATAFSEQYAASFGLTLDEAQRLKGIPTRGRPPGPFDSDSDNEDWWNDAGYDPDEASYESDDAGYESGDELDDLNDRINTRNKTPDRNSRRRYKVTDPNEEILIRRQNKLLESIDATIQQEQQRRQAARREEEAIQTQANAPERDTSQKTQFDKIVDIFIGEMNRAVEEISEQARQLSSTDEANDALDNEFEENVAGCFEGDVFLDERGGFEDEEQEDRFNEHDSDLRPDNDFNEPVDESDYRTIMAPLPQPPLLTSIARSPSPGGFTKITRGGRFPRALRELWSHNDAGEEEQQLALASLLGPSPKRKRMATTTLRIPSPPHKRKPPKSAGRISLRYEIGSEPSLSERYKMDEGP